MTNPKKSCPKCGITGRIDMLFGYRKIKHDCIIPQSYCTSCRSKEARRLYHQKKEKANMAPTEEIKATYTLPVLRTEGFRVRWNKDQLNAVYAQFYPNDKTRRGLPDKLRKLIRKGVALPSSYIAK